MATVEVRNGYKYYGSKSKPTVILNNLNMTVQPGTIYGLLGASGCGKTTLLSCIVGHKQLNGGEVRVLGEKPGVPGSGIPGSRIGYMPQEIALVGQMNVRESIFYFGRLYGMPHQAIYEKYESLKKLLELPPSSRLIKNCSGGQQRRVSFACALIHDPELLILDEPTVGLDPMLRERIWDFLVTMTRQSNTAVIITTHYIEEAKQANWIGLMRNGILLAEDTPDNILLRFEVNSIEDAFLILSQRQGDNSTIAQQYPSQQTMQQTQILYDGVQVIDSSQTTIHSNGIGNGHIKKKFPNSNNSVSIVKALLAKNFINMGRNPVMVCFLLLLPFLSLGCFYMSVGKTVRGQKLGIVNTESTCEDLSSTNVSVVNNICYLNNISCKFIRTIKSTDYLKPVLYNNVEDAHRDAKKSLISGYIHIPENFSTAMQVRIEEGQFADDDIIEQSIMATHLDMGAGQSTYYTEMKLYENFHTFIEEILQDCNLPIHLASVAVHFNDPIYGSEDADYQQFMAPGIVLTMVFFINTMVTANIFIEERADGVWDRTLIAGVSTTLMLWTHLLTQLIMTAVQNTEIVIFIAVAFNSYNQGSAIALVVLMFLVSVGGMFFGLLLSVYCKNHTDSSYVTTGSFYVLITTCGLMWPLEGMPAYLQKIVLFTPFTLPAASARNIIEKGWEITDSGVYQGFLTIIAWIIIFYVFCVIGLRRKM